MLSKNSNRNPYKSDFICNLFRLHILLHLGNLTCYKKNSTYHLWYHLERNYFNYASNFLGWTEGCVMDGFSSGDYHGRFTCCDCRKRNLRHWRIRGCVGYRDGGESYLFLQVNSQLSIKNILRFASIKVQLLKLLCDSLASI